MSVSFTTTADWTASVTETKAPGWISVKPTSGKAGQVTLTIHTETNESAEARAADVVLACGSVKKTIKVTQAAGQQQKPDESWFKVNFWDRTDTQKNGLCGPVKTFEVVSYADQNKYTFDREGHLIREDHPGDGYYEYTYDAQGRRLGYTYTLLLEGEAPYVNQRAEYVYDNGDRLVAATDFWSALIMDMSESIDIWNRDLFIRGLSEFHDDWIDPVEVTCHDSYYSFDAAGNLTIRNLTYVVDTYAYESDGRAAPRRNVQESVYTVKYEGDLPVSSRDGQMNIVWRENGMPAKYDSDIPETVYTWYGNQVTTATWLESDRYMAIDFYQVPQGYAGAYMPTVLMRNTFNEYGNLIQSDQMYGDKYSDDGTVNSNYYTKYEYDQYGNWVSREQSIVAIFTGERAESTITREIEYY